MNLFSNFKAVVLTAATVGVMGGVGPAMAVAHTPVQPMGRQTSTLLAQTFGNTAVNESNFLVVSVPGSNAQPHRLFIVEQLQPSPACWSFVNPTAEPTEVNALWNSFDFSGVCRLQRDSNGYAVWLAGADLGPGVRFQITERNGDLLLQFAPTTTSRSLVTIGRTNGISSTGFTQIDLNPGWSLTKRTYQGQVVSSNLVYFTNAATLAELQAGEGVATGPSEPTGPVTPPANLPFNDIRGNRYATDIARAAELGIISGFAEDGTFRPTSPLTREQAVSVVMNTAGLILPSSIISGLPTSVFSAPFPDVAQNRWSAVKIQQAKELGLVTGDFETGNFRPTDNVSRAELMAMMNKLARLRSSAQGGDTTATPVPGGLASDGSVIPNTSNPPTFTDLSGHWSERVVNEMAGYCGVATPLNETGTNFAPEADALRDYAASASVRMVDCPAARPQ
ncbi:MAG: DUF3747 domain-containing protein [Nodosilinea sp.]